VKLARSICSWRDRFKCESIEEKHLAASSNSSRRFGRYILVGGSPVVAGVITVMLLRGPDDSHVSKMEISIEAPAKVP